MGLWILHFVPCSAIVCNVLRSPGAITSAHLVQGLVIVRDN